jgi:hypothetical protein
MPANRVYALIESRVQLPAKLYQLDGSVWNGNAATVIAGRQRFDNVSWAFHPLALALGRLELGLDLHKGDGQFQITAGRSLTGDPYIKRLEAKTPMADAEPLFMPSPLGLDGDLLIDIDKLKIDGNHLVAATGSVSWKNAGLANVSGGSVGDFEMTLETTDEAIKGVLKDSGGPLQITGLLTIKPDGNYQMSVSAALRDQQRNDIKQGLRFLGTPSPDGKVTMNRSGVFPLEKFLPFIKKAG